MLFNLNRNRHTPILKEEDTLTPEMKNRWLTTRRAPTTKDEAIFTLKSPAVSTGDSSEKKNETCVASGGTCLSVAFGELLARKNEGRIG